MQCFQFRPTGEIYDYDIQEQADRHAKEARDDGFNAERRAKEACDDEIEGRSPYPALR